MSHPVSRSLRRIRLLLGACLFGATALAQAGLVTVDVNGMDKILAQAGIYVRVDPVATLYRTDLLLLDYTEFQTNVATVFNAGPIPVWFIDAFVPDGVNIGMGTAGLGWVGAGGLAVASGIAADAGRGAALLAHELGHNLGLQHDMWIDDLMYPVLYPDGRSLLSAAQIATMRGSSLLQTDATGRRFLEIAPIAVLADLPVPEPESGLLVLAGLAALAWLRRRA